MARNPDGRRVAVRARRARPRRIAPQLRASKAQPDRSVQRVVAERGWVEADELERLTGEPHEPTVGRWVVDERALADASSRLVAMIDAGGPLGLDVAALDERDRA